jgi:hypothetical protein
MENGFVADSIRQSLYLYPALEIIHILGIVLLVGAAFMFDLRLLGFSKKIPIQDLADHLLTWSKRGLWLIVPSGLLLFTTNAEVLGFNPVFWTKMAFIFLGGLNAFAFHMRAGKSIGVGFHESPPPNFRITAVISLVVWIVVIACGRLLAY